MATERSNKSLALEAANPGTGDEEPRGRLRRGGVVCWSHTQDGKSQVSVTTHIERICWTMDVSQNRRGRREDDSAYGCCPATEAGEEGKAAVAARQQTRGGGTVLVY